MSITRTYDAARGGWVPTTQAVTGPAESVAIGGTEDRALLVGEVWKDLVRFVLLNARDLAVCCALFGKAAMVVRPARYRCLITKTEHAAMAALMSPQWRHKRGAFGAGLTLVIDERVESLRAHSPLSLLLMGEADRHRDDLAMQEQRREVLDTILMACWRDAETGAYAQCVGDAFRSFIMLASQDTSLMASVNQTEWGRAFDQTRAAISARSKRTVKARLRGAGMLGVTPVGGKSESAVKAYHEVQQGNHCRASAGWSEEKRREHEEAQRSLKAEHGTIPIRPDLPRNPVKLRAYLRELEEAADRRRLGVE